MCLYKYIYIYIDIYVYVHVSICMHEIPFPTKILVISIGGGAEPRRSDLPSGGRGEGDGQPTYHKGPLPVSVNWGIL